MGKRYWAIAAAGAAILVGTFLWYNRKSTNQAIPEPTPIVYAVDSNEAVVSPPLEEVVEEQIIPEPVPEVVNTPEEIEEVNNIETEEVLPLETVIEESPEIAPVNTLPEKIIEEPLQPVQESLDDTIRIASFNIQIFGKSKRQKEDVMYILANTVRNFDIVAIQEIRDKSKTTLPYFLRKINELPGDRYNYVDSIRLGRTSSKEQYAFIYNTTTVRYKGRSYIYRDTGDRFERDPFIAGFVSGKFDYVLVNVHIKPDDAAREIAALADVVRDADFRFRDDKDIIVLGDFNADGSYFSENVSTGFRDGRIYCWAITDDMDTTVSANTNTYDRIVFRQAFTSEDYAGKPGVFLFDAIYDLTNPFAKRVSDHYPVSCSFYIDRDTD